MQSAQEALRSREMGDFLDFERADNFEGAKRFLEIQNAIQERKSANGSRLLCFCDFLGGPFFERDAALASR